METMTSAAQYYLAGDLGGTKTNLAIFSPARGPHLPVVEATFASGAYPNLTTLVQQFLEQVKLPVQHACFGVAGPVVGGGRDDYQSALATGGRCISAGTGIGYGDVAQ